MPGLKVIARVDVSPGWARPDDNPHGPPLNYSDYGDFIARAGAALPHGLATMAALHAIEVWNEPNLQKDWGYLPVNRQQAADYTRLLQGRLPGGQARRPQRDRAQRRAQSDRLERRYGAAG